MKKELQLIIEQFSNKNGLWYVKACVSLDEIMENDKRLFKFLQKVEDEYFEEGLVVKDNLILLDDLISALVGNRRLYNEYADFIEYAMEDSMVHRYLAIDIYNLCGLIKNGENVIKDDMQEEVVELINYAMNRKELELPNLCSEVWNYIVESDNWEDWLFGEIKINVKMTPLIDITHKTLFE